MAQFAKVSEVTLGTKLVADGGFTCLNDGDVVEANRDADGDLFVPCASGTHMLDAQLNGDEYTGFVVAPTSAQKILKGLSEAVAHSRGEGNAKEHRIPRSA